MFPDFSLSLLIFWIGVGGVLYHYAGYPVGIWLLSRVFGRPPSLPDEPPSLPFVSVVVSALNEEDVIRDRIVRFGAPRSCPFPLTRSWTILCYHSS